MTLHARDSADITDLLRLGFRPFYDSARISPPDGDPRCVYYPWMGFSTYERARDVVALLGEDFVLAMSSLVRITGDSTKVRRMVDEELARRELGTLPDGVFGVRESR